MVTLLRESLLKKFVTKKILELRQNIRNHVTQEGAVKNNEKVIEDIFIFLHTETSIKIIPAKH